MTRRARATSGSSRRPKRAEPARDAEEPQPLTRTKLEQLALGYLNRFDTSAEKLRRHLALRARKLGGGAETEAWIAELLARYRASGLLDDARFAKNLSEHLSARGKSARAIAQKLAARGVAGDVTTELLAVRAQERPDAELAAARAYVRKRRLGPYRDADQRDALRRRDLASLARQGFSFDIACRALGPGPSTDDDF